MAHQGPSYCNFDEKTSCRRFQVWRLSSPLRSCSRKHLALININGSSSSPYVVYQQTHVFIGALNSLGKLGYPHQTCTTLYLHLFILYMYGLNNDFNINTSNDVFRCKASSLWKDHALQYLFHRTQVSTRSSEPKWMRLETNLHVTCDAPLAVTHLVNQYITC